MNPSKSHITADIHWVGVVDWNLRDFHGYSVSNGASYNAYLIKGPEPILVDTVKAAFADEFLEKVAALVDFKDIKHFIVNHIEPDHSGTFPEVLKRCPNIQVYASENAALNLPRYYDFDHPIRIMRSGETLSLGGREIQFLETPMAHWPDSMASYMPKEKVLFSSDIFGQFGATSERFDTEIDFPHWDAALYYANIIMPYNPLVLKTLELVQGAISGLEYVLPDHGVIWTKHIPDILACYVEWASCACAKDIVVVYDSMWQSTEMMAGRIYQNLVDQGMKVKKLHIRSTPVSKIITEVMFAKVILIGTPTLNETVFPSVGQLLCYMQGLRPGPNRLWSAFGSYGWGGGGVTYVEDWFRVNQYEQIVPPLEIRFRPKGEESRRMIEAYTDAIVKKYKSLAG